ncbi:uncharacterized protein LOC125425280 [Sphaerodactylus townsendi]|uniref:uncharacterized protein LOC125425280 n=1 Tax=Sphaerodactylus townsendi TaxID=933632 RepID=UPI002025EC9E|nr:uncharacterized protein LOC125425280 [Sphaerodactylus townsendi]
MLVVCDPFGTVVYSERAFRRKEDSFQLLEVVSELCSRGTMASIREVSSIAEDLLCSICLSIFQEPRMLGCGHNFCLSCLESCVIAKGQPEGTCPECRCPFSLQDAVCNRVLANLAEKARLLKLEEGSQSDGPRYFCEEHEEPLKLFCSEDAGLVCVICRDLPQHQDHHFLPVKNAVKECQGTLKTSLEPLEDGMKWATNNKSRQQEEMEELENLSQRLYGQIYIEFENLRQILDAKEQSMMDTVKQMKEDNQAEMEMRLGYLKAYKSSHAETISRVRAALEESNEFALLQGIKELMARIQDCLEERNREAEHEVSFHDLEAEEAEDNDIEDEKSVVDLPEGKGNETKDDDREAYGEYQEAEESQDTEETEDIIPVDPALGELEEWLDFETWKEMLESISIGEDYNADSSYWFPSSQEDMLQPREDSTSEAAEEKAASPKGDPTWIVDVVTSVPDKVASDQPSSCSVTALPTETGLLGQPPSICTTNYFPVPVFQPIPLYNAVQRWSSPYRGRQNTRRGWGMPPGGGAPARPRFWSRQGQGRSFPTTQKPQHVVGSWSSPKKDTFKTQEAGDSGRGRGWFSYRKPQSSGSSISGQRGGGGTQSPKPRGAQNSGQGSSGQGRGSSGQGRGSAHPLGRGSSGQGRGPGRGNSGQGRGSAHPPGRGGSGQGRGSAHHSGGQASSNKGTNWQTSHRGGRGSGSAKGSGRK